MTPLHSITVDQLEIGMRLGQSIRDQDGVLIAAGDQPIDASTLALLRKQPPAGKIWVTEGFPEGADDKHLEHLRHLFRHLDDTPAGRQLFTALLEYRRTSESPAP